MNRSSFRMLAVFLCGAFSVVVALRVVGRVDHFVLLWPVSAVEIGLLLPYWRRFPSDRRVSLVAVACGVFAGGTAVGMPIHLALPIALFTSLDVYLGCRWMGPTVHGFDDLRRTSNLVQFAKVAVVVPAITGVLGSFPVSRFLHQSVLLSGAMGALANSVGIGLILPLMLLVGDGGHRRVWAMLRQRPGAAASVVFLLAVSNFVFWQHSGPFLFMVFPPLMLVSLAMGLEGAVLSSLLLTGIAWAGTMNGRGPVSLLIHASPDYRLAVLQGFIWFAVATVMPTGALLDERRRSDRKADEARAIYQTLLDHADDMIVLSSLDGSGRYVSPAVEKLTGWTPEEYLAMDRMDALHPEDRHLAQSLLDGLAEGREDKTLRYRILHKDSSWVWVEAAVRVYRDAQGGAIAGYVGTVRDITKTVHREATWAAERAGLTDEGRRLTQLASTDPLTGLLNRRGLDEAMRNRQHRRGDLPMALLMLDVDYFKLYNDTLGHAAGDECLKQLAHVLSRRFSRSGDLVARIGGEEFLVVLRGADLEVGSKAADDVLHAVRDLKLSHPASPLKIVTVSIGVTASVGSEKVDFATLHVIADEGLYESKRSGRNRASLKQLSAEAVEV